MSESEPERLEVDGHRIAVHRFGTGRPVVFVHGITTYSFIWRRIVPLLADGYELITFDLLGCGDSDMPLDASYSLEAHASRLHSLVETLGLGPFHLVGHDLGGGIAQIHAVQQPDSLLDLTLVNSVASDFWPVQPILALRTPIIRQLLMATLDLGTFRMLVRRGVYHQERVTPELMRLFQRSTRSMRGRKAFLHFTRCLDSQDLIRIEDRLGELDLPVMILRGDSDLFLAASNCEWLHKTIRGSLLERIATGGHFLQEDEPEWIADRLRTFFGSEHERES